MAIFKDEKNFVDEIGTVYEHVEDEFYDYKLKMLIIFKRIDESKE